MRWLVGVVAAMGLAFPAAAGMRAVYDGAQPGQQLEIEVADNGDFRVGPAGQPQYALQRDRVLYLVSPGPDGRVEVARAEDMAATINAAAPAFRDLFTTSAVSRPLVPIKAERGGPAKVGGRAGTSYRITASGPDGKPETTGYVLSSEAQMAPIGTALGRFIETTLIMAAPMLGPESPRLVEEVRAVFALGTPLRKDGRFALVRAEPADVPASRLELPAAPLDRAELARRFQPQPIAP